LLHTKLTLHSAFTDESTMTALKPILGDDFPFYVFGNNANRAAWVKKQTNFVVMDFHLVSDSVSARDPEILMPTPVFPLERPHRHDADSRAHLPHVDLLCSVAGFFRTKLDCQSFPCRFASVSTDSPHFAFVDGRLESGLVQSAMHRRRGRTTPNSVMLR
jgi:hypothetical protein